MGYNVFTMPTLTTGERKRLVYGYSHFDKIIEEIEKERVSSESEKLIAMRKKHGRSRS